ncbi:MAG: DUF2179 domain-containing protein [Planctomycetota bacterium]
MLVERLKAKNYGVTSVDAQGSSGQVKVVFTLVPRREVPSIVGLIKTFNPQAFYSGEEVGFVEKGVFAPRKSWRDSLLLRIVRPFGKGKWHFSAHCRHENQRKQVNLLLNKAEE